ncbi:MAG: methionine gamma-lyase family protein [Clostridiaceae bacterium]|nr:methionine gamma-lyase family protein [Clostridiaceae bacterium]
MSTYFEISDRVLDYSDRALKRAEQSFAEIERIGEYNQQKVLSAFIKNKVSETDFNSTTGYGYGDIGREKADRLLADIFGCEDAIIRAGSLACGTHTLGVALYGVLRPGDVMLSVTGLPYDTIHGVIGIDSKGKGQGTLEDFGVKYEQIDLTEDDEIDYTAVEREAKRPEIKMVYIQRSRGYSLRHSISVDEIKKVCDIVHAANKSVIVMVDNCYGEFVEEKEPTDVGADLMAGSLIKNAGGGIAPSGGYIAGRKDLVELCSYRMTVPGLGREVGATLAQNRNVFFGLFNAPNVVKEALKTAAFASALFEEMGYSVTPKPDEKRHDIIQAICLRDTETLKAFCQGMQKGAPVDSFVVPEPWDMPGYDSQVIMSAGAFTSGSSIELSADAPLREPYAVWMQGGLNFASGKVGVMLAAEEIVRRKLL